MTFFVTFIILFLFWMVMAGRFDQLHISMAAISALLVSYMSCDLLFKDIRSKGKWKEVIRFIAYIPWLLYQILLANLHIARLVLSPKMDKL